jgi:hypothetical protein
MNMQSDFVTDFQVREKAGNQPDASEQSRAKNGRTAVYQARLIMLVMINVAQLWMLAATVDAALARRYSILLPLVVASGICFVIALSILRWWRPTSGKRTSSGYVRATTKDS